MLFWLASKAQAQSSYLPVQASDVAESYDTLFNFLTVVSIIAFVVLMGGMIYFIFKYRRRSDNDKTAYISHNHALEFLWSFIPLVVFLGVFYWGWKVYEKTRINVPGAIEVNVLGEKWTWTMEYNTGKKTLNELTIPIGKPVRLIMRSKDVLHSFFVPSFRVKQDVVPGYISKLNFTATKVGRYRIFCAEYCGTGHSGMMGWVNVVEEYEYEDWVNELAAKSPVASGEEIYKARCAVCHTTDGNKMVGPSFKGVFGRETVLEDGSTVRADENYLRESILNPNAKVVKGYVKGQMPLFQGTLEEEQVTHIIEFMKTLK